MMQEGYQNRGAPTISHSSLLANGKNHDFPRLRENIMDFLLAGLSLSVDVLAVLDSQDQDAVVNDHKDYTIVTNPVLWSNDDWRSCVDMVAAFGFNFFAALLLELSMPCEIDDNDFAD